ncbi:hypothetical protein LIER_31421 [Lithospermum erythrorhizon]|uniref:Uncharacterized protein n=1 Tax=Lithospermum erythrorhizon TaxID=34254 RepID=A0AAV3RU46_LITER
MDIRVSKVLGPILHLFFSSIEEKILVVKNGPCCYDNQLVVFKEWATGEDPVDACEGNQGRISYQGGCRQDHKHFCWGRIEGAKSFSEWKSRVEFRLQERNDVRSRPELEWGGVLSSGVDGEGGDDGGISSPKISPGFEPRINGERLVNDNVGTVMGIDGDFSNSGFKLGGINEQEGKESREVGKSPKLGTRSTGSRKRHHPYQKGITIISPSKKHLISVNGSKDDDYGDQTAEVVKQPSRAS